MRSTEWEAFNIFDRIFANNDILGLALNAYTIRNEVIQHNIANVDTPDFKKKVVDFERAFAAALDDSKRTGRLDIKRAEPKIRVINENFNYRLDGNNVDIDLEMVDLYQNGVKYDVVTSSIINNYKKINLVVTGR